MKKLLIALALCLLMVGLIVSPALAATQKVPLGTWLPVEGGSAATGYATFITNQGDNEIVVNVLLKKALAKTRYDVFLAYEPQSTADEAGHFVASGGIQLGYLKTNSLGNWGGQNQQYSFEGVLERGTYYVFLFLIAFDPVTGAPIERITAPIVTTDPSDLPLSDIPLVKITGN